MTRYLLIATLVLGCAYDQGPDRSRVSTQEVCDPDCSRWVKVTYLDGTIGLFNRQPCSEAEDDIRVEACHNPENFPKHGSVKRVFSGGLITGYLPIKSP